jgi:hypothetical protein
MGITEGTVKVYMSRLFDKVGASDRFALALLTLRNVTASPAPRAAVGSNSERAVPLQLPRFVSRERTVAQKQ